MVCDRRFTALPMVGMVPCDAIEIVATRLSVFARGDLESNSHTIWVHAWCWRCPLYLYGSASAEGSAGEHLKHQA